MSYSQSFGHCQLCGQPINRNIDPFGPAAFNQAATPPKAISAILRDEANALVQDKWPRSSTLQLTQATIAGTLHRLANAFDHSAAIPYQGPTDGQAIKQGQEGLLRTPAAPIQVVALNKGALFRIQESDLGPSIVLDLHQAQALIQSLGDAIGMDI